MGPTLDDMTGVGFTAGGKQVGALGGTVGVHCGGPDGTQDGGPEGTHEGGPGGTQAVGPDGTQEDTVGAGADVQDGAPGGICQDGFRRFRSARSANLSFNVSSAFSAGGARSG